MNLEELRKLAEEFFDWPTEDRSHVTLTSALLFAEHVLRMTQQQAEPVEYQRRMRPLWDSQEVWTQWEKCTKGTYEDCIRVPVLHDWEYQVRALYTAPQAQPAPIPTGWQPIESAPDGLHLRAAWVYNVPNHDWIIEVHSGYVDDYGMFVNQYGDTYGIAPNGYFGWQPLPPAPGGSDD